MEIIRIGNDKLKLILTDGDLAKYSLKLEGCCYDNTETRRVLWQILDEAKKETGFDAAAEKTLVQAYPGRRGGCEIYVTRLCSRSRHAPREALYCFEDTDTLFCAAKLLASRNEIKSSSLYRANGSFYLLLLAEKESKDAPFSPLAFLEEYAEKAKHAGAIPYIKEHGDCLIAENALSSIEKFMHYTYKAKKSVEE